METRDEKRAKIIADQAAREATQAEGKPVVTPKPRLNWAASAPRRGFRNYPRTKGIGK